METISELREMLQAEKIAERRGYWGYRLFQRGPSIYITRLLLPTRTTANQITLLSIAVGVLGIICVSMRNPWVVLLGFLFLYLNLVLDEVDGEVARYKKTFSIRGIYLDAVNHLLIPGFALASLAIQTAMGPALSPALVLTSGVVGGLSWMALKALGKIPAAIFIMKYLPQRDILSLVEPIGVGPRPQIPPLIRKLLGTRFQLREFFVGIIILGCAYLLQNIFTLTVPLFGWILVIYGFFLFLSLGEEVLKGTLNIERTITALHAAVHREGNL